ncbi:hypothetical protein CFC21_083009 [Triticum aestivum]|uniref:Uncharacterized protein n=3 Tax=Triticum TaxID=4564 RepID=A0A3B6NPL8_WHEAT|nr:uncharacterized protein LOC119319007 [Triticum dicoccoides]XP_044406325.1 uncharacterized protein LOC123130499 [Triticum aestivum]XP_048535666.1 uncharacterized protein LOC125514398 [Triticum urartu]KAF7078602.1 hypothetical protein CFC21_083009 [Triticum aestivum]
MASVVIETHDAAVVGGADVVFCVIILCMSVLSLVILAASSAVGSGDGEGEGKRRRRSGSRGNGPVFVGGRGCACGGCRAGAGVCGTYLS